MLEGRCSPLMISCHSFLLITSTSPPRAITRLYSSYRSSTDLAMIGKRLMGVPEGKERERDRNMIKDTIYIAIHAISRGNSSTNKYIRLRDLDRYICHLKSNVLPGRLRSHHTASTTGWRHTGSLFLFIARFYYGNHEV